MRLFYYELKKILNWKVILLLLFVNYIIYTVFISFELNNFPNGRPKVDIFKIEKQLIPQYGSKMVVSDYKDMQKRLKNEIEIANTYLANDPEAVKLHMNTYDKYANIDHENEAENNFSDKVVFERNEDFPWRIQAYNSLFDLQNDVKLLHNDDMVLKNQKKRIKQLIEEKKFYVYSELVPEHFKFYMILVASTLFISILIVISPVFLRDRKAIVLPLQYTSKIGRSIYGRKLFASIVAMLLITIILLGIYSLLYLTLHTAPYFSIYLYAFELTNSWYDITFLQFILLTLVLLLLYTLLLNFITMVISSLVNSYATLIAIQIITIFCSIYFIAYFAIADSISIQFPQIFMPLLWSILTIVVVSLVYYMIKREGERDIV